MKTIVSVCFKPGGKSYSFDPGTLTPQEGQYVLVETARGQECGEIVQGAHTLPDSLVPTDLKPVIRLADDLDLKKLEQNREDERKAFVIAQERIEKYNLEMSLVDVEYTFNRSKLLFHFTSDGRVDFRELVKDLAGIFRTRIELRQIGVRDETKMLGGLGICGQPFCCSRFLKNFHSTTIKMAKEQGLSLNPAKISGNCGRLMCCLAYEQPAYEYLGRITPGNGSVVSTPDGTGTVVEVNLISGQLRVRLDSEPGLPRFYPRTACAYLRGGKRAPVPPEPEETEYQNAQTTLEN